MKKIISILAALMMCFTLTSCVTYAQAQVDDMYDDNVDISVVVSYGTPYYNTEGLLLYYIYRDMYYYPYYYHNRYYLHRYSRPLPPSRRMAYKPVPRDFYRDHRPPQGHNGVTPPPPRDRGSRDMRPNKRPNDRRMNMDRPNTRPNNSVSRPNTAPRPNVAPRPSTSPSRSMPSAAPRSSTRATVGGGGRSVGGHVGHRR